MEIISEIINIKNNGAPDTGYIESELKALGINPLRWSIVKISKDFFTINTAYDRITVE
ncbi:MAG: hypothetical protein LUB59_02335 [Candidatus Gastranaerophilales bacterium]|nr:hypothetical protein [Candidatus Gastranaerophilales bacterium]